MAKNNSSVEKPNFIYRKEKDVPEFFAEGFSEAMIGIPTSRIVLHAVREVVDGKEIREPAVRLVMPTQALLEMCRNILAGAVNIPAHLPMAMAQLEQQYKSVLADISVPLPAGSKGWTESKPASEKK